MKIYCVVKTLEEREVSTEAPCDEVFSTRVLEIKERYYFNEEDARRYHRSQISEGLSHVFPVLRECQKEWQKQNTKKK